LGCTWGLNSVLDNWHVGPLLLESCIHLFLLWLF
jgi:hypothetical protein